jgi:hypothetical protein
MFSKLTDLAAYIRSCQHRVIVFDGRCGAGKTSTMHAMRAAVPLPGLDGDAFLQRGFGPWRWPFIEALQLSDLKADIEQALRLAGAELLSTVCARQVVDLADLPEATFIYVEHASPTLLEIHKRDFDDDFAAPDPDRRRYPLHWEIEEYHRSSYRPRARADAVFFSVKD